MVEPGLAEARMEERFQFYVRDTSAWIRTVEISWFLIALSLRDTWAKMQKRLVHKGCLQQLVVLNKG